MAAPSAPGTRKRTIYAAVNLLWDRETHRVGADISHIPDELLEKLLDRGEATLSKPPKPAE